MRCRTEGDKSTGATVTAVTVAVEPSIVITCNRYPGTAMEPSYRPKGYFDSFDRDLRTSRPRPGPVPPGGRPRKSAERWRSPAQTCAGIVLRTSHDSRSGRGSRGSERD